MSALTLTLAGVPEVLTALRGVKFGVGNRVIKNVLAKHARIAAKDVQALVPQASGYLRKSITAIYRKPMRSSMSSGLYAVGPRRDAKGYAIRLNTRAELVRSKPVRYAHLVEKGRRAVKAINKKVLSTGSLVLGTRAQATKPRPFIEPVAAQLPGKIPEMARDVRLGIAGEALKYEAFGKSIYG